MVALLHSVNQFQTRLENSLWKPYSGPLKKRPPSRRQETSCLSTPPFCETSLPCTGQKLEFRVVLKRGSTVQESKQGTRIPMRNQTRSTRTGVDVLLPETQKGPGSAKRNALHHYAPNIRKALAAECYAWRHTIPPDGTAHSEVIGFSSQAFSQDSQWARPLIHLLAHQQP